MHRNQPHAALQQLQDGGVVGVGDIDPFDALLLVLELDGAEHVLFWRRVNISWQKSEKVCEMF